LEPEKESSLWPLAILGILVSSLAFFIKSKSNQASESIHPEDSTNPKGNLAPWEPPIIRRIPPSPPNSGNANGGKDNTPPWKKRLEFGAVIAALGIFIANSLQTCASYRQLREFVDQERPWVSTKDKITLTGEPTFAVQINNGRAMVNMIIPYSVTVENFGHSPAYGEYDWFLPIFIPTDNLAEYGGEKGFARWWCDFTLKNNSPLHEWTSALFPGQSKIAIHTENTVTIRPDTHYDFGRIGIIGCIFYRDGLGKTRRTELLYHPTYAPMTASTQGVPHKIVITDPLLVDYAFTDFQLVYSNNE